MEDKNLKIHQEHDKLFKIFFKLKETLVDYVENFLPAEISNLIDLSSSELDDTSYITPEMKALYSDVVHKAKFKSIQFGVKMDVPLSIAFLFDHKLVPEDYVHLQILNYKQAIWRKDRETNNPLTFVLPIIIYQGKTQWKIKPFENYFPNLPSPFLKYLPSFECHFTNANDINTSKLEKLKSILGPLFLAYKHLDDIKYLEQHLSYLFKSFEEKPNLKEIRQTFVGYVKLLFNPLYQAS